MDSGISPASEEAEAGVDRACPSLALVPGWGWRCPAHPHACSLPGGLNFPLFALLPPVSVSLPLGFYQMCCDLLSGGLNRKALRSWEN